MRAALEPRSTRASSRRGHRRDRPAFAVARRRMVERLARAGHANPRVAAALLEVPRHRLVPEALAERAYQDVALPIGEGQTISAPSVVAAMTQALVLGPQDRVLEVGTGSAYQTAVLAHLAGEVVSIECLPRLAARARRALDTLGVTNAVVHLGDGSLGRPGDGPYDAILVTAGGRAEVPPPLLAQLRPGGRLVGPFGSRETQELLRLTRDSDGALHCERLGACHFVALVGRHGWSGPR